MLPPERSWRMSAMGRFRTLAWDENSAFITANMRPYCAAACSTDRRHPRQSVGQNVGTPAARFEKSLIAQCDRYRPSITSRVARESGEGLRNDCRNAPPRTAPVNYVSMSWPFALIRVALGAFYTCIALVQQRWHHVEYPHAMAQLARTEMVWDCACWAFDARIERRTAHHAESAPMQ